MSIESAKACIEKMKSDKEFAKKIMAETTMDARIGLAQSEGLEFTAAEIEQVACELRDEELDAVSGGVNRVISDVYPVWCF